MNNTKTFPLYEGHETHVTIPDDVTTIEPFAFSGNKEIESVTLGASTVTIGMGAFYDCNNLKEVKFQSLPTEIGSGAFVQCPSLADDKGFIIVANELWGYYGGDAEVTIPDSVKVIRGYTFDSNPKIESVTISNSVTEIGDYAFRNCGNLARIESHFISNLKIIGEGAFIGCRSLAHYDIPIHVRDIGKGAFANCDSLIAIDIPYDVTEISELVFRGCDHLRHITIPDTVTKIALNAIPWGDDCIITCHAGSYAELFARYHSLPHRIVWDHPTHFELLEPIE